MPMKIQDAMYKNNRPVTTLSLRTMLRGVGLCLAPAVALLSGCQGPIAVQTNIEPITSTSDSTQGREAAEAEVIQGPSARVDAGRLQLDPLHPGSTVLIIAPEHSGMDVFTKNCQSCHTLKGKPAAPQVPDLTDPVFSWTKTPQDFFRDLRSSPAHAQRLSKLTAQEIWNSVFYTWSLHSKLSDVVAGGLTFNRYCSVCHGTKGLGDGNLSNDLNPMPRRFTDFAWMVDKTDQRFYISLQDGRPPSAMPSWKGALSPTQMIQIINYLRTFDYNYPEDLQKRMAEAPPPS